MCMMCESHWKSGEYRCGRVSKSVAAPGLLSYWSIPPFLPCCWVVHVLSAGSFTWATRVAEQVWVKACHSIFSGSAVNFLCAACQTSPPPPATMPGAWRCVPLNSAAWASSNALSRNCGDLWAVSTSASQTGSDKHHCFKRQGLSWDLAALYLSIGSPYSSGTENKPVGLAPELETLVAVRVAFLSGSLAFHGTGDNRLTLHTFHILKKM